MVLYRYTNFIGFSICLDKQLVPLRLARYSGVEWLVLSGIQYVFTLWFVRSLVEVDVHVLLYISTKQRQSVLYTLCIKVLYIKCVI